MPPLPPTPAVPGWWPGSGPGAGSSPNRGPSPSPSPRPGPNPGPTPTRNGNCSKHDNESCEQQRTRCLATSMADLPGHLWGHSRCMECYEGCIRNGGNWPSRVARTKGTVRCDYWNF
jgi:hypothetical protein